MLVFPNALDSLDHWDLCRTAVTGQASEYSTPSIERKSNLESIFRIIRLSLFDGTTELSEKSLGFDHHARKLLCCFQPRKINNLRRSILDFSGLIPTH